MSGRIDRKIRFPLIDCKAQNADVEGLADPIRDSFPVFDQAPRI
jgi:hypothetical protein